jgi:glucose/arabinose dehydrogenase
MKNLYLLLIFIAPVCLGQHNHFRIYPTYQTANVGSVVLLEATGCGPGGTVTWPGGDTGTYKSFLATETTKVTATCTVNGQTKASNNEALVEVIPCPETINLNSGLSGGSHTYQGKYINGSSFIDTNTNAQFKASNAVALKTGFEARPGSTFTANIEACPDTSYIQTRRVANSLNYPWEILWGPSGKLWVAEKSGKISYLNPADGNIMQVIAISDVLDYGEGGLLGMTFHPDFDNNPYFYVVYNYGTTSAVKEKVVRYTWNHFQIKFENPVILLDNIEGFSYHNGSRLLITPDLKLFITTGDAGNTGLPQDTTKVNGKILRINLDGSIPADNPYPGSPVWSIGHRNPQGMVYVNDKLYVTSHGANIEDEINLIQKKGNYGWPNVEGPCDTPAEITFCNDNNVIPPIFSSGSSTWAFCGLDYYSSNAIAEWQNHLLMVSLKNNTFYTFQLSPDGNSIVGQPNLYYTGQFGRLRDIAVMPNGFVYIITSNGGNNDQIIEIRPAKY